MRPKPLSLAAAALLTMLLLGSALPALASRSFGPTTLDRTDASAADLRATVEGRRPTVDGAVWHEPLIDHAMLRRLLAGPPTPGSAVLGSGSAFQCHRQLGAPAFPANPRSACALSLQAPIPPLDSTRPSARPMPPWITTAPMPPPTTGGGHWLETKSDTGRFTQSTVPRHHPATAIPAGCNRWFDPRTLGWLSEDPLGDVDSPNLYQAFGYGPHLYFDPLGLSNWYDGPLRVLGWGAGVVEEGGKTAAAAAALPVTAGTNVIVDSTSNALRLFNTFQQGGLDDAWREAKLVGEEQTAESRARLKAMIPGVHTYRQAIRALEECDDAAGFQCGRSVGHATFSLGLDATVVYGAGRAAQTRMAAQAEARAARQAAIAETEAAKLEQAQAAIESSPSTSVPQRSKGRAVKEDSIVREKLTESELLEQYPNAEVQSEHYLRDSSGRWMIDEETGTRRRLDHVVILNDEVIDIVETTSRTADKTAQLAKEARIMESGGNYIRRRNPRKVIQIKDGVISRIKRQE